MTDRRQMTVEIAMKLFRDPNAQTKNGKRVRLLASTDPVLIEQLTDPCRAATGTITGVNDDVTFVGFDGGNAQGTQPGKGGISRGLVAGEDRWEELP